MLRYILALALLAIPAIARADTYVLCFTATWCPHCQTQKTAWEQVAREVDRLGTTDLKVVYVDVDESKPLAAKYKINTIPATVVVHTGADGKTVMDAFAARVLTQQQVMGLIDQSFRKQGLK
jgi:thiol-disulfide isomerase/thioredoxin